MNPDPRIPGRLTRRRFALALPLLGALAYLAPGRALASAPGGLVRESRVLMGTRVDIVASAQGADAHEAVRQAFAEMERLEALMSRYRADSDVGRIAAAAGRHAVPVAPEVMAVLRTARRLHRESGGAFDITVGALAGWRFEPGHESVPTPAQIGRTLRLVGMDGLVLDERAGTARLARPGMALDLGGVAKLPILDAGLRALARAGVHDALVNGGGDVLAAGSLQGRPWRERGFVRAGRRLHHVLDPRTGWPTEGVHGVALRARTVDEVNGWGTALMVRGAAQAGAWHAQHPGVDALVADAGGARWLSQGMAAALKNIG
jgi:thiamine biosynthesis lipoprotein